MSFQLSAPFNGQYQTYNITATSMRNWRNAVAKAKNAEGRAHIVCHGDSVTSGFLGTSPQYSNSWPARLRALIDSKTGVVSGTGWVKPAAITDPGVHWAAEDAGENRFTLAGTWSQPGSGVNNKGISSGTGGTVTIGPITCDRIRIYYATLSNGGTVTSTLDGSASTSFSCNNATFGIGFQDYTAASGSHTLVLTAPNPNFFYFNGWEAWQNGTTTGVRVSNLGHNGATASGYSGGGQGLAAAFTQTVPDLSIIAFGTNDIAGGLTTYNTKMQTLITQAKLTGDVLLVTFPPTQNDAIATQQGFVAAQYALADSNNVGLLDLFTRWGDHTTSSQYFADTVHPNGRGYIDMANAAYDALINSIGLGF